MNTSSYYQRSYIAATSLFIQNLAAKLKLCISVKYKVVFSLLLVSLAFPGHSQTTQWQWLKQSLGSGKSQVKNLVADKSGNTYVVGFFTEKIKLDSITLVSRGHSDLFVGKLSPTGHWQWAIAAGSPEPDQATSIALDAEGRIFVTGGFTQQLQLGKTTLTSRGGADIFVAQVSAQGQWLWATSAGGADEDWPRTVTASNTGNLLVAGQFAEEASFGVTKVVSRGSSDAFVAQITPTGSWQWVATAGGGDNDAINAATTTKEGDVYVTGFFSNLAIFGTTRLSGQGMDDAFVGRLSSTGQWQWATAGTGTNTAYGLSLANDPDGGVYVTGSFNGDAQFGTNHLDSKSGDDGFVGRVTETGKWDWLTTLTGDYMIRITGITPTKQGKLYVAGTFCDAIQAGAHKLASQGKTDILLGVLDHKGSWLNLTSTGGNGEDEAYTLTLGKQGGIRVGGWCDSALTVGATHF